MTDNESQPSAQIFSIPIDTDHGRGYLIYAPLKGIAFIANPALVNLIVKACERRQAVDRTADTDDRFLDFLYTLDFFTPEPVPGADNAGDNVSLDTVVLFLSNRCNLACVYCYASANSYAPRDMPPALAKAAIDHFIQTRSPSVETLTLAFHGGGEPTMNPAVLTGAVDYARGLCESRGLGLRLAGSSNGTWSDNLGRFMVENFDELSISFDGPPEVQNRQRPLVSGGPSFPRVKKNLDRLDRAGFNYGIRMTVTETSLDRMPESVDFICNNTGVRKIQVEPVFAEGRAIDNRLRITKPDRFIEQFRRAHAIARGHDVHLFYSGARPETITTRFCLCAGKAFVVTPEGDVTACFEVYGRNHPKSDQFIIGAHDGNGGFSFHRDRHMIYRQQCLANRPECRHCFCKWHCAGDCMVKTGDERTGQRDGVIATDRCYLTREITKYLIGQKIIDAGGLICTDTREI